MKKGTCQSTSTNASQLVKKEEKEWNGEIYPIKAPEQKISESKTIKRQKPFLRKWKLHVEKTRRRKKNGRGSGHHEITSFPRSWHHEKTNHHAVPVPGPRKTVYEKCRSRGSQIGFKSLPFWMLQVFSTILQYTWPPSSNLLPQWVSLHSTSASSKSNRWEKSVSKQWAGKPVSFFPFLSTNKEVLAASTDGLTMLLHPCGYCSFGLTNITITSHYLQEIL